MITNLQVYILKQDSVPNWIGIVHFCFISFSESATSAMSDVTSFLRFPDKMSFKGIRDLAIFHVPFPRLHFLTLHSNSSISKVKY